jgi:glutamate dehydrogenase/leucine dehydrogenase
MGTAKRISIFLSSAKSYIVLNASTILSRNFVFTSSSENNQGYYWSEEEVNTKLRDKMVEAFNTIYDLAEENYAQPRKRDASAVRLIPKT